MKHIQLHRGDTYQIQLKREHFNIIQTVLYTYIHTHIDIKMQTHFRLNRMRAQSNNPTGTY